METSSVVFNPTSEYITQDYSQQDINLLNEYNIVRNFGADQDIVEFYIYSADNTLIAANYDFKGYNTQLTSESSSLYDTLYLDPVEDVKSAGYEIGEYNVNYFFYRNLFLSNFTTRFYIKEISSDRTEIKIATNNVSYNALGTSYLNYIASKQGKSFYSDFILNFGDNNTLIGVNSLLDTEDEVEPSIFIKLYEPLPTGYNIKDQLWVVEQVSDPYSFNVNIEFTADEVEEKIFLRGPNTDIDLNEKTNSTTEYLNLSNLLSTPQTSSYQQLQSILEEKSVDINIDYTEYKNFVHFSSAKDRLENFKYKLNLIQSYQNDINSLKGLDALTDLTYISSSEANIQENIDTLIKQFDGYEYFLYYTSGSKAWPKSGSTIAPFTNFPVNSDSSSVWYGSIDESNQYYGGQLLSASLYDGSNMDYIWNQLPAYIKEDPQNATLGLLVGMLGQSFDSVWTYSRALTDLKNADNRIDFGISKDMVADALRSLGIKLYTSDRTNENIYEAFLGLTPSGSNTPSTGSQRVTTYVTASNETTPYDDINKEVYKRIYHNLPYLLKTKGSHKGLRALLNCFGIPNSILKINEFGGDQKFTPDVNQVVERFDYSLKTNPLNLTSSLSTSIVNVPWLPTIQSVIPVWSEINVDWNVIEGWWNGDLSDSAVPDNIEFRFKTKGIPSSSHYSQSLFQVNSGSHTQFGVQLFYPSTSNSSYGSAKLNEIYSKYGELRLIMSGNQGYVKSNPIYLPFFSQSWWNVNLARATGSIASTNSGSNNEYTLTAKSADYNGIDGTYITYQGSSSLAIDGSTSSSYNNAWNAYYFNSGNAQLHGYLGGTGSNNQIAGDTIKFDGFFQEFRYWNTILSESQINQHALNARSITSHNPTSSRFNLVYRLPLGSELDISGSQGTSKVTSVHPAVTGSVTPTGSFLGTGSSTVSYGLIYNFMTPSESISSSMSPEDRYELRVAPNIGAYNVVDDKIRIYDNQITSGSTLSPYTSIQERLENPYTLNTNNLEVAFSTQDSINNDIVDDLGYFNIDEYIGDPKLEASSSYPQLEELKDYYFQKYTRKANVNELLQLLSYYDSSLFKMVKDFAPATSQLATGFLVKPTILERSKMIRNAPTYSYIDHSGSVMVPSITGSNPMGYNLNTSYTGSLPIYSGSNPTDVSASEVYPIIYNQNSQPFTGEYSGSELTVYTLPTSSEVKELSYFSDAIMTNQIALTYSAIPVNPELNNVMDARTSVQFMDLDYSTNVITPVNVDLITSRSLGLITEASSSFLDATVQDSYYTLLRQINPRYLGSKNTSKEYNVYNVGDTSYGQTAAIDLNSMKFAYFAEIVETGSAFPQRSNVYLKYLIDERSNVTELTRDNKNIFELQNIFNHNKQADVSLDNNQEFSDQKYLDGLKPIYAGGYSYLPILQNPTMSSNLTYKFTTGSVTVEDSDGIEILPGSLGGNFISLGAYDLGNIKIQSGSSFVSLGGYPSITLTRSPQVNQSTIWWDNDLMVNFNGELEIVVNIPSNISASFESILWNPFDGAQPIISSSTDYEDYSSIRATYFVTNSVIIPKKVSSTDALLTSSPSALGGYFETSFTNPQINSASFNLGLQSAEYSDPKYTYYYPSDPIVSFTGSIEDGGDASNGDAFFKRNTTGSFNILTASVSMSYWYGNFIQSGPTFSGYQIVDEEFTLEEGDLFRFYDSGSQTFPIEFERQVKSVNVIPRDEVTNTRRLTIEFGQDVPARACEDFSSNSIDATQIKKFIILKKMEDETNIVLNFEKQQGRTSSGIVLPSDLPTNLVEKAGNIVKNLKSQNLIS